MNTEELERLLKRIQDHGGPTSVAKLQGGTYVGALLYKTWLHSFGAADGHVFTGVLKQDLIDRGWLFQTSYIGGKTPWLADMQLAYRGLGDTELEAVLKVWLEAAKGERWTDEQG